MGKEVHGAFQGIVRDEVRIKEEGEQSWSKDEAQ